MEDVNEINECISLEEIPRSDSHASVPSPSVDCPSTVTEDADVGDSQDEVQQEGNAPDDPQEEAEENSPLEQESPSVNLPQELDPSEDGEDAKPGESVSTPPVQPRVIAVTPQLGDASPDVKGDLDSGVKIDDEDGSFDKATPEKPARTPSLVSCEGPASSRSTSPDQYEPTKPALRKGGSSQPPKFKNEVEPMDYQRQPAPAGYNRAVHSVQCKAMIIIMTTSIIAVILVVGFIILSGSGDDGEAKTMTGHKSPASLDGVFSITNRLYKVSYADNSSIDYQRFSQEFISTVNATFQNSERFQDFYEKTTVDGIRQSNISISEIARPVLDFTLFLMIQDSDLLGQDRLATDAPGVTGQSLVSHQPTSENDPTLIDDIIDYLVNVTASSDFGNFTGIMILM
ncbi:uncharacterized protein LOC110978326 [Acanthaster planci]|uniref:Uncharacterized protein LOC110978326 n=1 Tax=Acanthaster planci TaxID=133434 RepID=A0A8B7Y8Q6_ACAPL|nr:uncharacterized protein LOC110978326 [Acanthaster planci]